jgi:hypothetical protein
MARDCGGRAGRYELFWPAKYITVKMMVILDNISTIRGPLLEKYPSATAKELRTQMWCSIFGMKGKEFGIVMKSTTESPACPGFQQLCCDLSGQ